MELFRSSKLQVTIGDANELIVSEKSGFFCSKEVSQSNTNLENIIEMVSYNGGSCVAIAASDGSMNLKMNKAAVAQLIDRWNAIPKSFTKELLFENKNSLCYVTSHGYLLLVTKNKFKICCCKQEVCALAIFMADIVLCERMEKMLRKDSLFICTEKNAIEVESLEVDVLERLLSEVKQNGAKLSEGKAYSRAFKFTLIPEKEYIYTTAKGVGYYYKKRSSKSAFHFVPWDDISHCVASKGCLRKEMMLFYERSYISTLCKFPAGSIKEIVEFVNARLSDNAGKGEMFGKGKNQVLVTDTHIVCIGKKDFVAYPKPYNDGRLIKKEWCSSYVDISGFQVKVGRYEWKGFCCNKGAFYEAVTAEPSRELTTEAQKHRF